MPSSRRQLNVRLTPETEALLDALVAAMSRELGITLSQSDVTQAGLSELRKKYLPGWAHQPTAAFPPRRGRPRKNDQPADPGPAAAPPPKKSTRKKREGGLVDAAETDHQITAEALTDKLQNLTAEVVSDRVSIADAKTILREAQAVVATLPAGLARAKLESLCRAVARLLRKRTRSSGHPGVTPLPAWRTTRRNTRDSGGDS